MDSSVKLRAVSTADGRIGWPDVVEYELVAGPEKGKRLAVPPTYRSHPDPAEIRRPDIASVEGAKAWAEWKPRPRSGYPYVTIVHDWRAYYDLIDRGCIHHAMHWGGSPAELTDHRIAPKG